MLNIHTKHIIGLTGGIGSGKSFVAKGLMRMGFQLYDTESEAKRIICEEASVRQGIINLFGPQAYQDNRYQTAFVAAQVFENDTKRLALNALVHPAVIADIQKRTQEGLWVIESALLFESGINRICDKTIAVIAPEEIRLQRILLRDKMDIEEARKRIHTQQTEQELIAQADIIVNNDGKQTLDQICRYIVHNL